MRRKNFVFIMGTLFLICITAFCISGTVKGQGRLQESEENYRMMEEELLRNAREYLNRNGYRNSGVTLTRVVDAAGGREYTFTIHHGRIDRMEESGREALRDELACFCREAGRDFPEDICTFRQEFLILAD